MKYAALLAAACLVMAMCVCEAAVSPTEILSRVKSAESGLKDFSAEMFIVQAHKENVSEMGEGYQDILKLEKAVISFKKPDKIRYDGYALGLKVTYIQNGYTKLVLASMVRHKDDVKHDPGKRQDTVDLGFITSRIWTDNKVYAVSTEKNGVVKLKLVPKWGAADNKRHDFIWVDPKTLRVTKREKYRGSGEMRASVVFSGFERLVDGLPIATVATMFNAKGEKLGTINYKNVKANVGLPDSQFSLSTR